MRIIQLEINTPIHGHPAGSTVRVQADEAGVPLEKHWRDRLRDAEIDYCVTVMKKSPSKTSNKSKEKS